MRVERLRRQSPDVPRSLTGTEQGEVVLPAVAVIPEHATRHLDLLGADLAVLHRAIPIGVVPCEVIPVFAVDLEHKRRRRQASIAVKSVDRQAPPICQIQPAVASDHPWKASLAAPCLAEVARDMRPHRVERPHPSVVRDDEPQQVFAVSLNVDVVGVSGVFGITVVGMRHEPLPLANQLPFGRPLREPSRPLALHDDCQISLSVVPARDATWAHHRQTVVMTGHLRVGLPDRAQGLSIRAEDKHVIGGRIRHVDPAA